MHEIGATSKFFEGIGNIDFQLLKTIGELVKGYEVESVPLYHWEEAILKGYQIFRKLRKNCGGFVQLDFKDRMLLYCHAPIQEEAETA